MAFDPKGARALVDELRHRGKMSDCWCPNRRAADAITAALDEIERLRAALAWAVDSLEYQYPGSAPDFEIPKSIRAALKGSDQ